MRSIKFKIDSEKVFTETQEKVFENNGSWFDGSQNVIEVYELEDIKTLPYGFSVEYDEDVDKYGFAIPPKKLFITYFENEEEFLANETCEEISFEEFMKIDDLVKYLRK